MRIAAGAANKARHYTKTENTERVRTASRTVRRGSREQERERERGGGRRLLWWIGESERKKVQVMEGKKKMKMVHNVVQ